MRARRALASAGFTLIEVMIALAILGLALTMLVRSIAGNIGSAQQAMYMGIVSDLARGKMYDIEEHLVQDGLKDTEEQEEGDFADEGWPAITWEYRIIPVELPPFDKLLGIGQGDGAGTGDGTGEDLDGDGEPDPQALRRFENSALNGVLSMFGAGIAGGDDGAGAANLGMVQMVYPMIADVMKKSIRKIVLTVRWDTGFDQEHVDFVMFIADTPAMCKAIPGGAGCR